MRPLSVRDELGGHARVDVAHERVASECERRHVDRPAGRAGEHFGRSDCGPRRVGYADVVRHRLTVEADDGDDDQG